MDLNTLKIRRKKLHRMLNVCKQKQMACKLYLKEKPELASRTMLQYLATLESKQKHDHFIMNPTLWGVGLLTGFILLAMVIQINFTLLYLLCLFLFLALVFGLPYYNSRQHISKTKTYIRETELPGLKLRIKNITSEIDHIAQSIEELLKKQQKESHTKSRFVKRRGMDISQALSELDLPESATFEEAKKAFRKKIIQFHPDRTNNLTPSEQKKAEAQTVKLNQAYAHIKKVMKN